MAELDEMARHRESGGAVVEADAGVAPHRVDPPGQDVGPAVAFEQREQGRIVVEADEDEGVDAAADELLGGANLSLQVVVMLGKDERVTLRVENGLQCARGARIERVVE